MGIFGKKYSHFAKSEPIIIWQEFFFWDSFAAGVAISAIHTNNSITDNEYCVLNIRNVTVITSNKPYGINDGSNPFFNNRTSPRFNLLENSVHSGHVQTGLTDPFCLVEEQKGKCQVFEGYTFVSIKQPTHRSICFWMNATFSEF